MIVIDKELSIGLLLIFTLVWISVKNRWLSFTGVIGLIIISTILYFLGNIIWFTVFFGFLGSASILTRYKSERKKFLDDIVEKNGPRDIYQAFANVGFPAFLSVVYFFDPNNLWILGFLGSMSAVMADTWATEIGSTSSKMPVLITDWKKRVPAGTSGGITIKGTIGGMIGASYIALVGIGLFNYVQSFSMTRTHSFLLLCIIVFSGIVGLLVDSLLGATIQVAYKCDICGVATEKRLDNKKHHTQYLKGIKWVGNDLVNFIASVFGGATAMSIAYFI